MPRCRVRTPLPTVNDTDTGTLTASAPVAVAPKGGTAAARSLASSAGATVLAAEAGSSGTNGDYKATSLQASGSWSAGSSSGGFSWDYPLAFPAVPSGLAPKLSLSYSSQSVDGRTSATNNQPGADPAVFAGLPPTVRKVLLFEDGAATVPADLGDADVVIVPGPKDGRT
ncbi:hypothetical protein ACWCQ0_54490, partial [Streptomyces massasporeus]